jgi:alpha-glucosidase (family GH31 glycosyl hydrolase)
MQKFTIRCLTYLVISAFSLIFISPAAFSAGFKSGNAELLADKNGIVVRKNGKAIIKLNKIAFNYENFSSWEVSQIHGDEIVLRGKLPSSVEYYRAPEDTTPRDVEIAITREPGGFRIYANHKWGRQITLEFEYLGDHFFGLSSPLQPDNRLSPDLTGSVINVDVNSEGAALRENYATVYSAFYMSSFGYGAFFDTFARGRYEFAVNGANRIHHDTGIMDWYIFIGDNGAEIHNSYYKVIGPPKQVPAWGLGPVGWRDQNNGGAEEILQDVARLSEMQIPFTSWFVDRPYSDGAHAWSKMNFAPAFANPGKWITKLRNDYGLEFMTWSATATFGDERFPEHLKGAYSYVDLSHPESWQSFQNELHKQQYRFDVKGHKIDRGDEAFPVYENWHDGTAVAERRNKYAFFMLKVHHDILRKTWGDDQITFARSAIHRSQPYLSAVWGGDPRTTWEGMQGNFANAIRTSYMGFPVWGTDVGGYQGDGYIPEDLYTRWLQAGSMTGLFEIKFDGAGGSGRDRMPWQYDETFQKRFRDICAERMRLLPYFYSLVSNSANTGAVMQPMAYRHLTDNKTYVIWDQFYVGEAILVAPVFDAGTRRDVYLPEGEWFDFDNPASKFKGGKTISVEASLDKLPRFIKENSIYVSGNIYHGNDKLWNSTEPLLTIHAFPARRSESQQFTYVDLKDNSKFKSMEMSSEKGLVTLSSPAIATEVNLVIRLDKAPKDVMLNGALTGIDYDDKSQLLSVPASKGQEINLSIRM